MANTPRYYTLDADGNRVYSFRWKKPVDLCPDGNCTIDVTYIESPNPDSPDATSEVTIKVRQCSQLPNKLGEMVQLGLARIFKKASYFHVGDNPITLMLTGGAGLPPYDPIPGEVNESVAALEAFGALLTDIKALPEPPPPASSEGGSETIQ